MVGSVASFSKKQLIIIQDIPKIFIRCLRVTEVVLYFLEHLVYLMGPLPLILRKHFLDCIQISKICPPFSKMVPNLKMSYGNPL